jgi:hypothetical protein
MSLFWMGHEMSCSSLQKHPSNMFKGGFLYSKSGSGCKYFIDKTYTTLEEDVKSILNAEGCFCNVLHDIPCPIQNNDIQFIAEASFRIENTFYIRQSKIADQDHSRSTGSTL